MNANPSGCFLNKIESQMSYYNSLPISYFRLGKAKNMFLLKNQQFLPNNHDTYDEYVILTKCSNYWVEIVGPFMI